MKRKPLRGISFVQILAAIAELDDVSFGKLQKSIYSSDAFDDDKERIEPLALSMDIPIEDARAIISGASFLYSEVHDKDVEGASLDEAVHEIINTIKSNASNFNEYIPDEKSELLNTRLKTLLKPNPHVDRFTKSQKLRTGFLPSARSFGSFVDLRPLLSDDRQSVLGLIPIIQFKIFLRGEDMEDRPVVFQMDERSLRSLKDAADAALQKLDVITSSDSILTLVERR